MLYIKPPNTWSVSGAPIVVPRGVAQLGMGGTVGIVFGRAASRVNLQEGLDCIGGWVAVNDVSIPHASYYRPAIKERCRDGFCPIGSMAPASAAPQVIRISVNGELKHSAVLTDLIRGVGQLIVDVSEFMTLRTGDILLVGEPHLIPLAGAGDRVRIEVPGVGFVENELVAE